MFLGYLVFYALFVAINVGSPLLMERIVWKGMNFATVYGFGLIVFALVQAVVYDAFCRSRERALEGTPKEGAK